MAGRSIAVMHVYIAAWENSHMHFTHRTSGQAHLIERQCALMGKAQDVLPHPSCMSTDK